LGENRYERKERNHVRRTNYRATHAWASVGEWAVCLCGIERAIKDSDSFLDEVAQQALGEARRMAQDKLEALQTVDGHLAHQPRRRRILMQTTEQKTGLPIETKAEDRENTALPPPKRNLIQVWYHQTDGSLLRVLDRYLQAMYRRLGPQVEYHYFGYSERIAPKPYTGTSEYLLKEYETERAKYEQAERVYRQQQGDAVARFPRTRLFVPCVSNAFLQALDGDLLHHEPLGRALQAPAFAIVPIVVRPVETGANFPAQPLCLYEGAALEMVCKEYASVL
jgi:hypothetical protein